MPAAPYKYVFFGSPEFSAIILDRLIRAGFPPLALVCNPDRPFGRKKTITPPPVKKLVEEIGQPDIRIFQPEKIDSDFIVELKKIGADFYLVAAYSKILPGSVLEIPARGVIGVHPSLLPKYRGSTPIQSAILSGDEETGVTLYLMDEGMDHGSILKQQASGISRQDYLTLQKELAEIAGEMLIDFLPDFVDGKINPRPQDEAKATFTRKFENGDAYVSAEDLEKAETGDNKLALEIWRKIRALNPEPGVWILRQAQDDALRQDQGNALRQAQGKPLRQTQGKLQRIKLLEAKIENGSLKLTKIQKEGGKPIEI